jgi:hypothetical protein
MGPPPQDAPVPTGVAPERESTPRWGRGRDPELVAQAAALRASGLYWRDVAAAMGVSVSYAQALACDPDGSLQGIRNRAYYRRRRPDNGQLRLPV